MWKIKGAEVQRDVKLIYDKINWKGDLVHEEKVIKIFKKNLRDHSEGKRVIILAISPRPRNFWISDGPCEYTWARLGPVRICEVMHIPTRYRFITLLKLLDAESSTLPSLPREFLALSSSPWVDPSFISTLAPPRLPFRLGRWLLANPCYALNHVSLFFFLLGKKKIM